jgi:hypothetical protein
MKTRPYPKRKPQPSGYQISLRNATIKIIVAFALVALAIGAAVYVYQRHRLIP